MTAPIITPAPVGGAFQTIYCAGQAQGIARCSAAYKIAKELALGGDYTTKVRASTPVEIATLTDITGAAQFVRPETLATGLPTRQRWEPRGSNRDEYVIRLRGSRAGVQDHLRKLQASAFGLVKAYTDQPGPKPRDGEVFVKALCYYPKGDTQAQKDQARRNNQRLKRAEFAVRPPAPARAPARPNPNRGSLSSESATS